MGADTLTAVKFFDPGRYNSQSLREMGFGSVGENVSIDANCALFGLSNIFLGDNVRIDSFVSMVATKGAIKLGSNIHIGSGCHLIAADELTMDDFSGLSQGVKIYTATDDYSGNWMTNPTVPHEYTRPTIAPVRIGRHVIIGSGSVILPGVAIGEGSSVGALSLVTKSLEPWGLYFGSPAKRLRSRSQKLLELEQLYLSNAKRKSRARRESVESHQPY